MAKRQRSEKAETFAEMSHDAITRSPSRNHPEPVEPGKGLIEPHGPDGEALHRVGTLSEGRHVRRWLLRRSAMVGVMNCGAAVVDWIDDDHRADKIATLLAELGKDVASGRTEFMTGGWLTEFVLYRLDDQRHAVVAWRR